MNVQLLLRLDLLALAGAFLVAVVAVIAWYAGLLDSILLSKTKLWYGAMVQKLSCNTRLLDIGSGVLGIKSVRELLYGYTLDTLVGTLRILLTMEVDVVALQENETLFKKAYQILMRVGLKNKNKVILHNKSIYDKSLPQLFGAKDHHGFNAVVFSTPLMSLQDPVAALRVATSMLKEDGVVYIPQVYRYSGFSGFLAILAPLLKHLHIAPVADVVRIALEAGLEVSDDVPASGVDVEGKTPQVARLLVLQRAQGKTSDLKKSSPVAESDGNVRSRKGVDSKQ